MTDPARPGSNLQACFENGTVSQAYMSMYGRPVLAGWAYVGTPPFLWLLFPVLPLWSFASPYSVCSPLPLMVGFLHVLWFFVTLRPDVFCLFSSLLWLVGLFSLAVGFCFSLPCGWLFPLPLVVGFSPCPVVVCCVWVFPSSPPVVGFSSTLLWLVCPPRPPCGWCCSSLLLFPPFWLAFHPPSRTETEVEKRIRKRQILRKQKTERGIGEEKGTEKKKGTRRRRRKEEGEKKETITSMYAAEQLFAENGLGVHCVYVYDLHHLTCPLQILNQD